MSNIDSDLGGTINFTEFMAASIGYEDIATEA